MSYSERFYNFTQLIWQILVTICLGLVSFILPAYIQLPSYQRWVQERTCFLDSSNGSTFCILPSISLNPPSMFETLSQLLLLGLVLALITIFAVSVVHFIRQRVAL